jgi:hypothetical protein
MCLTTNWKKARIAKRDIVCYKILITFDNGKTYFTPTQHTLVKEFPILQPYFNEKEDVEEVGFNVYEVNGGFIHTYMFKGKRWFRKWMHKEKGAAYKYVLFKAIIPKGTRYYRGTHSAFFNPRYGYVSRYIKLLEKINEI